MLWSRLGDPAIILSVTLLFDPLANDHGLLTQQSR